ncbi:YihY/virulence factor BrkB family protein [Bacillaceae bacterium W0354]
MIFEKQFWKELYTHFLEDDVAGMSAQLAYFFLLALLPFLIFLLTLIGYLPISNDVIFNLLSEYMPPESLALINNTLSELTINRNGKLLSVGLIGMFWAASNGVNALMRVFNRAYHTPEDRSFIVTRFISFILTIAMLVVIAIALALPVFGRMIGEYIFSFVGFSESFIQFWQTIRWIISFIVIVLIMTVLFMFAPNQRVRLVHAFPGAIIATLGWQITSLGFSFYVDNFSNYSATYGSLGAIIVLMIWFFLSGMMIIIGGQVNAILSRHNRRLFF